MCRQLGRWGCVPGRCPPLCPGTGWREPAPVTTLLSPQGRAGGCAAALQVALPAALPSRPGVIFASNGRRLSPYAAFLQYA